MGIFFSGSSAMGCPPLSLELGAAAAGEADRREANPRHARYITAAATSADTIDAYTILSYRNGSGEGERGEGAGGRPPAAAGRAATCAARTPGRPFSELVPPCGRPEVDISSSISCRPHTPTSSGHGRPWHTELQFWPAVPRSSTCW